MWPWTAPTPGASRHLFHFDEAGDPTVVAGVPPDYFSPTGQLWGNPIYNWQQDGRRTATPGGSIASAPTCASSDIIRIDHFRGFYNYWEVPGDAETAINGRWVDGPREHFFDAVIAALGESAPHRRRLGRAGDPGVYVLRDHYDFPGMKVLQFAWASDGSDPFLPHNYDKNCVVYTGTHDNDTTRGWYEKAPERERDFVRRYLRVVAATSPGI